jgi:hypothetical protein
MQNLKTVLRLLTYIAIFIFINTIDFGISSGYFKSDIEIFQAGVNVYSKYAAVIFILIAFIFLFFKNRKQIKSKNPNIISPEFLKHTLLIIFIAIIIWVNFDSLITNGFLIINKQKQLSSKERSFKIYFYDEKKEELRLIVDNLEYFKMKKNIYKSLKDKNNIKLKFKVGLLGIPFDPEYRK